MGQRIRISDPAVNDDIRNNADAKMKMLSWFGHLTEIAEQFTSLHPLSCVDNEFLKASVERLAPWVGDADKAAISFAIVADFGNDAIVRGDDSAVGGYFKVDAIVSEERFGSHDKATVVFRAGPPFLNDTALTFKWRCKVDTFRFVTSVFDCVSNKIERHRQGVGLTVLQVGVWACCLCLKDPRVASAKTDSVRPKPMSNSLFRFDNGFTRRYTFRECP